MKNIVYAQLHAHSRYSVNRLSGEGAIHRYIWPVERQVIKFLMLSPERIAMEAKKAGLSYVAITDHNTVPEIPDLFRDMLIQGEEWGQKKGHANFLNLNETIEPECGFFRGKEPLKPKNFADAIRIARERGSFAVINHPFKRDAWLWGNESYGLVDAIEIWNGPWNEENRKALNLWQDLLERGTKIFGITGNDFHVKRLYNLSENLVTMKNIQNKNEFLNSLKKGNYSMVKNKKSPIIFLSNDLQYTIENYSSDIEMRIFSFRTSEKLLAEKNGSLDLKKYKNFVRIELWKNNEPLSFSNPIFI